MQDYKTSEDKAALVEYAKELGVPVDSRFNVEKIRAAIQFGLEREENSSQKRVNILIHKVKGQTGSSDVQVSVNGKVYLIKRGVVVPVPESVVEVLRNAVRTEYTFVDEGQDLEANDVLAYPFSLV